MDMFATAAFLALVANRIIEYFLKPLFTRFEWDSAWLLYVAAIVGAGLVWLSGVNLFATYLPNELAGRILTSIVAGGGANLLNDLFGTGE